LPARFARNLHCAHGHLGDGAFRPALADDDDTARTVVARSDEVRFPRDGFQVLITIESTTPVSLRRKKVPDSLQGNENTIVQTLEPATDRGQAMLMRGRDLWVFMPNISQPVRLSVSQRLTGQVANGDLARANFSGDYEPKILRTETIDGEKMYVLELTAVDRGVTYAKVLYWVRQSNNWPHRAEFYSLSERLLKVARYEKFQNLGGESAHPASDGGCAQEGGSVSSAIFPNDCEGSTGPGVHQTIHGQTQSG
jgi:hypothetical protein